MTPNSRSCLVCFSFSSIFCPFSVPPDLAVGWAFRSRRKILISLLEAACSFPGFATDQTWVAKTPLPSFLTSAPPAPLPRGRLTDLMRYQYPRNPAHPAPGKLWPANGPSTFARRSIPDHFALFLSTLPVWISIPISWPRDHGQGYALHACDQERHNPQPVIRAGSESAGGQQQRTIRPILPAARAWRTSPRNWTNCNPFPLPPLTTSLPRRPAGDSIDQSEPPSRLPSSLARLPTYQVSSAAATDGRTTTASLASPFSPGAPRPLPRLTPLSVPNAWDRGWQRARATDTRSVKKGSWD